MLFALFLTLTLALAGGQTINKDTLPAIDDLFPTVKPTATTKKCPLGLCLPDNYLVVTSSTTESSGSYIEKCGEGKTKGKRLCVNYEYCDGKTDTIVQNGLTVGFGIINIRFGDNRCPHPLEKCCKIPPGGLSPNFDPNKKPSPNPTPQTSTTKPAPTSIPVTTPTAAPTILQGCGIRNTNGIDFKLEGNNDNEAEYGEFPWMVALIKTNTVPSTEQSFSFCGGSLISPSVVLTVAHCVFDYKPNEIKIRAGEWDSQTNRERLPFQERNVVSIITHRHFNTLGVFNDVALLFLDRPLDRDLHIAPVCLPEQDQVIESRECFVSGWGKNVFGSQGRFQQILKKIQLPIVPFNKCQSDLRQTALGPTFVLHDSFMCAGGELGKDACTGDGGSPLVCPDPKNPKRYLLAGMVSWGIGCGEQNVPGAYANVAKFRKWIDEQLKQ